MNELDFIIEQLENLPNKKFDNQKIIYERQKRNKKQEDDDFLAELEAKAETDQQNDKGTHPKSTKNVKFFKTIIFTYFIVEKRENNGVIEPKVKYFQKLKRQPPPLVQDLRPEVLGMASIFYFRLEDFDFWVEIFFLFEIIGPLKPEKKLKKSLQEKL